MGVNICAYRLGLKDEYGDYEAVALQEKEWDSLRRVGDKEYVLSRPKENQLSIGFV